MHDIPLADFRNVYAIIYPTSHVKLGDTWKFAAINYSNDVTPCFKQ